MIFPILCMMHLGSRCMWDTMVHVWNQFCRFLIFPNSHSNFKYYYVQPNKCKSYTFVSLMTANNKLNAVFGQIQFLCFPWTPFITNNTYQPYILTTYSMLVCKKEPNRKNPTAPNFFENRTGPTEPNSLSFWPTPYS